MTSINEYAIRYRHAWRTEARLAMTAAAGSRLRGNINVGGGAPGMRRVPMGKGQAQIGTRHGAGSIPGADMGTVPTHIAKMQRQLRKVQRPLGKMQHHIGKVRRHIGNVHRQLAKVKRSLANV